MRYLLVVLMTLMIAACDSTVEPDDPTGQEVVACATSPPQDQVSYLPLEVGDTWVFDYEYRDQNSSGPTLLVRSGTLTWTVESVGACDRGRQVYRVAETLRGTESDYYNGTLNSESPFSRSETVEVEVFGDSALVPYADAPVLRFGPSTGPQSARYSYFEPDCIWGSCRTGGSHFENGMSLEVGRGLARRYYGRHYSAGGDVSEVITRRSE